MPVEAAVAVLDREALGPSGHASRARSSSDARRRLARVSLSRVPGPGSWGGVVRAEGPWAPCTIGEPNSEYWILY